MWRSTAKAGFGPTPNWDAGRRQREFVSMLRICNQSRMRNVFWKTHESEPAAPAIAFQRWTTLEDSPRSKERRRQLSKGEKSCSKQGHNFESTACRVLRAMSPRYDLRCQAPEVELVNSKPVRNKPPTHPHLNSSSRTRGHIAAAGLLARHTRCSINLKEHKRVT